MARSSYHARSGEREPAGRNGIGVRMSAVALDAERVKRQVRARLLGGSFGSELDRLTAPQRRLRVREEVLSVLREERAILPAEALTEMVNQVSDEVVGLGPVERLLKDPEVSE